LPCDIAGPGANDAERRSETVGGFSFDQEDSLWILARRHQGGGHGPRDRFGSVPKDLICLQGQHFSSGASHDRHAEAFCVIDNARLSKDLDDDLRAPCLSRASDQ